MLLHRPLRAPIAAAILLGTLALAGCQTSEPRVPGHDTVLTSWVQAPARHTYVVDSVADAGPGTLRAAIAQANASPGTDQIVFRSASGLFQEPQTIKLASALPVITDHLSIDGYIDDMLWKPSGITLDGQQRHRILQVAPGVHARIAHLTLRNGKANTGGGLQNHGYSVLSAVLLRDNSADTTGGAIHNAGTLQLINSTLYNNSAGQRGGALYNNAALRITHATFDRNRSALGGALYSATFAVLQNSILARSHAAQDCYSEAELDSRANIIPLAINCGRVFTTDDPLLGELGGYNGPTHSIPVSSRSPAFNWADNSASTDETGQPLTWDQRGNGDPRFALGIADIGAFEVQPRVLFEVDTPSDEDLRGCTRAKSDCSLRGALQLLNHSDRHQRLGFDADVFNGGGEIRLQSPLPGVMKDLRIDAGCVGPVLLTGASKLLHAEGVKLEVINIESR
ncbi:choice-of-anchor Q domain-containing protein [Marinobacterium rhizophilum]|uniref:Uncharacterized protein n=1 Tax=Marinobacterium rhizophilum TaxID=420402 RepID=A0ABY5HIH9_9GAMM|nr:choice-of-anchor Q domain-containing protein [Marinobacterium rhizophilum]UTW12177.1 hypothetical protein KDW95_00335 [Marinobacterium rhizophilum]